MSGPGFRYDTVSLPSQADFALRRNAEPPGLHSELHYHDHYELLFCFTGQLPYRVEGSAFLLESGSVLLIHPYQLHQSMPAQGNAERIALRFRRSVLEQRGETLIQMFLEQAPRHKNLLVLEAKSQRVIYRILNDMLREQTEDGFGRTQVEDALLTQMLFYLARAAGPLPSQRISSEERLVQRVIEYLDDHLAEENSLPQLAGRFFTDRYHLSRCFSQQVGCPPHRYLTYKRLQRAAQLMETGTPASHAAALCGFEDYSNFYRRFREAFGVTPRQWAGRGRNPAAAP